MQTVRMSWDLGVELSWCHIFWDGVQHGWFVSQLKKPSAGHDLVHKLAKQIIK
jgi:hypothetical protein